MDVDESCVFCRIVSGSIPSTRIHEDEMCVAFRDIDPKAPVHILVVPRRHVAEFDVLAQDQALAGHLSNVVAKVAREEGLADSGAGFRVVVNQGSDGSQSVGHVHYHLLGGRKLSWPPG